MVKILIVENKNLDKELVEASKLLTVRNFNFLHLFFYEYFFVKSVTKEKLIKLGIDEHKVFVNDLQENLNIYLKLNMQRLTKQDFSIISDDCWGAYIYTYLNIPYKSPFIWLHIKPHFDYFKLCSNLNYYLTQKLNFIETKDNYPVAMLDDIEIHFNHYKSEQNVKECWERRINRLNLDALYCKATLYEQNEINLFENIPIQNKIGFANKDIIHTISSKNILLLNNDTSFVDFWQVAQLQSYKYFDIINWLNDGVITPTVY